MLQVHRQIDTAAKRIGFLFAGYAFYLLVFFGLGHKSVQLWPEIFVVLSSLVMCAYLVRMNAKEIAPFFLILSIGIAFDLLNVVSLQLGDSAIAKPLIDALDPNPPLGHQLTLDFIFYALYLFLWDCAWVFLAYRKATQVSQGFTFLFVGGLMSVGIVVLLLFQFDHYNFDFDIAKQRFHFLFIILELIGVLLGLLCVLMGTNKAVLVTMVGFTFGTANNIISVFQDISFQSALVDTSAIAILADIEQKGELDPAWLLGKVVILAGLLVLPTLAEKNKEGQLLPATLYDANRNDKSGLSVYLLIFWLVSVSIAMTGVHYLNTAPHFLMMFLVLFCAVSVIMMAAFTSKFDELVVFLTNWTMSLFKRNLTPNPIAFKKVHTQRWLEVTGLDKVLKSTEELALKLRDNVIFLGPERLNRPPARPKLEGEISAFLVMPFSPAWSNDVAKVMRAVCATCKVRAIRGDDMHSTSDILDDIWTGIVEADFIIADVTGANANVFYELGMAHAIGKPVIILAQGIEDVPFDIASRRMIKYNSSDLESLENTLEKYVEELLKKYELRNPAMRKT